MSKKSKGINAEREIIHMFWGQKEWAAVRVAGSGSIKYSVVDVLAGKPGRKLAIECKSVKNERLFFSKEDLSQLLEFSKRYGAEPWIGIRFDNEGWYFLAANIVMEEGVGKSISRDNAKIYGVGFEELVGE
jgi:holliday junction resolvase Hjr